MSEVRIKKDDLGIRFTDTLEADAVNFATVSAALFLLRNRVTGTAISKTATVSNGIVGSCDIVYVSELGVTAIVGDFKQEWELTFSGGAVLTFPNDDYNLVKILEDLN